MNLKLCYTADFETTTNPDDLRVWAYSICNINDYTEFHYGTSIDEFFEFCSNRKHNYRLWFHNLKFDGVWLINYLESNGFKWIPSSKEKADKTYTTLITDMGQFYTITVYFKVNGKNINKVQFLDSLKIFPNFSVERVAEGFKLPIKKLKIDYKKERPIGYELTQAEIDYIRNDVEIMARALKEMFSRGLTKMTIAGDAMRDFRERMIGFRKKFPLLAPEIDRDVRASYRGGFTYANDIYKEKEMGKGIVLDVNSLYPSCQYSPYPLPCGHPQRFEGKYKEDKMYPLYVQAFTCSFEIKEGKIPSVQIKNSLSFIPNEYLKSSNGELISLFLTKPDFELFKEQYHITNLSYDGGWKFKQSIGLFDPYIDYWIGQKIAAGKEGNAPQRQIAKLMLNSLYGRFGISSNARQKAPVIENGVVKFKLLEPEKRETCYVPVAAFITAYGRNRCIRTAQAIRDFTLKKYGEDRWYYCDTDSCHANLSPDDLEELKDIIKIDDYELGAWAKEAEFTRAKYIRQKCYIEEVDGKVHVTVAGLPKYLAPIVNFENFTKGFSTTGLTLLDMEKMAKENGATQEEIDNIHHKLSYKYYKGGVILADTDFTIK